MSGISYDLKKIKGLVFDVDGVLSPTVIPTDEEGLPVRMCNVKDGYALQLAVKMGLKIAIITGGTCPSVKKRYNILGIQDVFMSIPNKLPVLEQWMNENDLKQEETAYMGDDIPDLRCMRHVGLSATPADGAFEAKETALYVSRFTGGYGCVRDLIEQVLRAQGKWNTEDSRLFSW